MKRNLLFTLIFISIALFSFGQTYEISTTEGEEGYLYVQMRETSGVGTPTTTNSVTDIVFQIKWLTSLGDVDMGAIICSDYEITKSGVRSTNGSYYYQEYWANNTPYFFPEDWVQNVWVTIAKMEVTFTGSGTGTFEVGDNAFVPTGVNIGVDLVDYTPTVNGSAVGLSFPTVIYDFVWVGGGTGPGAAPDNWNQTNNWNDPCGNPPASGFWPYQTTENVYIPVTTPGSGYYPEAWNTSAQYAYTCNNIIIGSGAHVLVPDLTSGNTGGSPYFNIAGDLIVKDGGQLRLPADAGHASVGGSTTIDGAEGIKVFASETGGVTSVGSFIDNGTISYGATGSADVQLHLYYGTPFPGEPFYFHQVGPTVDNTATFSGQYLEDFNLNPYNDYAYTYDESVAPGGQPWLNIWQYTEEIHTASAMMISTDIPEQHTLDMVGDLLTGTVTSDPLGHTIGGTYLEMISNPYPSAIDFDAFQGNNSSVIINKNWIWDASAHNYIARAAGAGGVQNIQVGQAFFVETLIAGTVSFANTDRVHSTDPFRDIMPNILTLDMESAGSSTADQLVIRFEEGATTGYDEAIEAIKWNSMNESAAMIRSIAEDGTELSVNVMPELDLQGETVSVPVHFQTGIEGEYTFIASDLESFEYGTEIWIEDKLDGNQWHNLSVGHNTYTFTATADDPHDRFIIHFFGPLGVDQFTAKNVLIYADFEYALIRNMTKNEIVKEISIYSLAGTMIMHKQVPEQNMYRFYVSNHDNFYIVRVVTDKNIYTEKIFVH